MNIRIIALSSLILTAGCSLEATLYKGASSLTADPIMPPTTQGTSSFLSYSEHVITTAGTPNYELSASFGEIAEKTENLNNDQWTIEGTFYE